MARPDSPQLVHGEGEEAVRTRRQVIVRQVFDAAARPPAGAREGRGPVGGSRGGGGVAQRGGAPSFTVGGSGGSGMMRMAAAGGGEQDHDQQQGEAGLRRTDLLRRILHAMRFIRVHIISPPFKKRAPKGNIKWLSTACHIYERGHGSLYGYRWVKVMNY